MKRIRNVFIKLAVSCLAISFASNAIATEGNQEIASDKFWLIPYEPNSIVYQRTTNDENSWEANFSFRYYFTEPPSASEPDKLGLFFSYTGKFDFYAGTRHSGPVVNRLSNPALHKRFEPKLFEAYCKYCRWLDIGIEHISNGQALDASKNQALILNAYNTHNHALLDTISRTAATVALTAEIKLQDDETNSVYIKAYARSGQEADVYWGEYANTGVNFNDFQLARFIWRIDLEKSYKWEPGIPKRQKRAVHTEWNIGRKGVSTDSWNVMVNFPFMLLGAQIPLAITAHFGPMNNLSNYTESQRSIGVGLAFSH